jgi:hypothetical protein
MSNREISIKGVVVEVGQPYAEGHVVTAAEAKALNQTRAENISNAMRAKITALASEDGSYSAEALAEIRSMVAEYDAQYEFSLTSTGGGRRATDPLEKECIAVARAAISAELKRQGIKVKDVAKEKLDENIEKYKDHPEIVKLAKKRLKERESLADAVSLDI